MNAPPQDSNPLISFALFAYNQERYVRAAVIGALSQTYSPLEIIIFDDGSQDNTRQIISDTLDHYSGPHVVRCYLNTSNKGLVAQVNKCFHLCNGEFIVMAAGDDISKSNRTSAIVEAWLRSEKKAHAIYCGMEIIDNDGKVTRTGRQRISHPDRTPERLLRNIHNPPMLLVGACSSYNPRIITGVGDLNPGTLIEDTPLTLRASVMGGVEYINETLVSYRIGSSTWLAEQNQRDTHVMLRLLKRLKLARAQRSALTQIQHDMVQLHKHRLAAIATERIRAKDTTISILSGNKVSIGHRIAVALASGQWREVLVEGTYYSFPVFVGLMLFFKRLITR